MINRPSYAQRTLELTRSSLERIPSDLTPVVSGIITARAGGPVDSDEIGRATTTCARTGRLATLRRWRRKGAPNTGMALR
jgi:hypothetical protein